MIVINFLVFRTCEENLKGKRLLLILRFPQISHNQLRRDKQRVQGAKGYDTIVLCEMSDEIKFHVKSVHKTHEESMVFD